VEKIIINSGDGLYKTKTQPDRPSTTLLIQKKILNIKLFIKMNIFLHDIA